MIRSTIKAAVLGVCMLTAAGRVSAESQGIPAPGIADSTMQAAPEQQALGDCLVDSVSNADKRALVMWIFSMLARHPDVKPLSNIDAAKREMITRDAGAVFEVLMADRCASQLSAAVKKSGPGAISKGFERLGDTAINGLLLDPDVAAGLADLMKHADRARIERAIKGE